VIWDKNIIKQDEEMTETDDIRRKLDLPCVLDDVGVMISSNIMM
jgi:hypothetical protein